jgi:hypothetical protein
MERVHAVRFEFVEYMPATLDAATLYVSIRFRTTSHLCLCGCGEKVVNPLRPDRWSVTFDGASISISPSVGNSGLPCRSHYWIKQSKVKWLSRMTDEQSAYAFERDGWTYRADEQSAAARGPRLPRWRRALRWLISRRRHPSSE